MPVLLSGDVDGEPTLMTCDQCGASAPFDAGLPYVKQTAAFDTGHRCEVDLDAMARRSR